MVPPILYLWYDYIIKIVCFQYEYTTLSLVDDDGGGLTTTQVTRLLNDYALDGWRLISAYANELGHNSTSGGFGGFSTGTNSTVDQHILILERFVRF